MGSSFVEYRGRTFWSRDGYLEDVCLLCDQRFAQPTEMAVWS